MIKKCIGIIIFVLSLTGVSSATLIDAGDGMIYDNNTNLYWYKDVSAFTAMNYQAKVDLAGELTNGGFDWAIASLEQVETLSGYAYDNASLTEGSGLMLFTPTFSNIYLFGIFAVTSTFFQEDEMGPYLSWTTDVRLYNDIFPEENRFGRFGTLLDSTDPMCGAWVVAQPHPAPEPATIFLLSLGLASFVGLSRRKSTR